MDYQRLNVSLSAEPRGIKGGGDPQIISILTKLLHKVTNKNVITTSVLVNKTTLTNKLGTHRINFISPYFVPSKQLL